jgi:hypothetical protein
MHELFFPLVHLVSGQPGIGPETGDTLTQRSFFALQAFSFAFSCREFGQEGFHKGRHRCVSLRRLNSRTAIGFVIE